ncbi:hypothetical protein ACHAWC_009225 [Mediolabrus comicus]
MLTPSTKQSSWRKTAGKIVLLLLLSALVGLQTILHPWSKTRSPFQTLTTPSGHQAKKFQSLSVSRPSHDGVNTTIYTISDHVREEYARWHLIARNFSEMKLQDWEPTINWTNHPKHRSERFPSADERVQYYMGKWYNMKVPMYGKDFVRDTFIQWKTTREYGPFSDILVNLYNLDKVQLFDCYKNKKEFHVMSPYCRDYIDLAILHSEGTANVIHNIGDGLPYATAQISKYPMFAKVRMICNDVKACKKMRVEPILLPLNRKRHYGIAFTVPENDLAHEKKIAKAVWRGQYGKTHDTIKDTNDIKFSLVSRHLNSTIVDVKFSKHTKGAPQDMIGSYMDVEEQLKYKYIISIEGNDVSSGLKWMLLSNSVVLMPKPTWESWAMEARLEPFVHYLPLKSDMSNVEEMIQWAEEYPEKTRIIAERSTLFIYDLLMHPQAAADDQSIIVSIMERFENNFGSAEQRYRPTYTKHDNHAIDRSNRFSSIEERVKYIMHDWYNDTITITQTTNLSNNISSEDLFVANGKHLSLCSLPTSSYPAKMRQFCEDSLPWFDERLTADLKSSSFARLKASERGKHLRLAPFSSWRTDPGGSKESKRVLLNDVTKILYFGHDPCKTADVPFFTSSRDRSRDCNGNGILWPFGSSDFKRLGIVDSDRDEEELKFRVMERYAMLYGGNMGQPRPGSLLEINT